MEMEHPLGAGCHTTCFASVCHNALGLLKQFGIVLESFWDDFGIVLESFWDDFGIVFE